MNSSWHTSKNLAADMLASSQYKFSPVNHTQHFQILINFLSIISKDVSSICDLGCGSGDIGNFLPTLDYTGYDLENIIENVSKIKNPKSRFLAFDAYTSNFSFLKNYDIILSNSFLSELKDLETILSLILSNTKQYLIILRQTTHIGTSVFYTPYKTYANEDSTDCSVGDSFFYELIKLHGFSILQAVNVPGKSCFLLERKK